MNRVFVIADTHFGHAKVAEARGYASVEAHDRDLVMKWNATVKPTDTVWHLGDVYLGGARGAGWVALGYLHGIKRLVLGNHDVYPLELYLHNFTKVFGAAELHGCLLTHVPCHPCQLTRYRLNAHGHLHTGQVERAAVGDAERLVQEVVADERYRCVSAEQTGYRPVLLSEVLA